MSSTPTPPPQTAGAGFEPVPPTLDCALLASPGAANVLRSARLSLLHSLPSVGIAWSLWCGGCGALREGLGGGESAHSAIGGGCKRDSEGEIKRDDGEYVADELERELERTLAAMAEASDMKVAPMPGSATARKPQRRRKNPRCTSCGTKFHRPKPAPPPYPTARAAARTRRQSALAQCVKADEPEDEVKPEEDRVLSPAGTVDASQLFGATPSSTPPITRAPSLAHLPNSDPATPTYPTPKAAPPPQPKGALSTTLPTSPPPAKKRKTKKSGPAKLLAQNAAREAEKQGSGNWGLG